MYQPYYMRQKKLPLILQTLNRPMLLLSLGLHALLLMIPIPSEPKKPEPPPKEVTVKISELLAPTIKPSPKPSPKAAKATPRRATPIPQQRVAPQLPVPIPRPNPIVAITPEPTLTPEPTSEATPAPTSEVEAGEFQDLFGQVDAEVSEELGIDPSYFKQPELFFIKESLNAEGEPQKRPGIDKIKWISLKTPDQVFTESLEPDLKSSGLEISEQGEYGGGKVYQVKKGSSVKYINLVPTASSVGTLIIVWKQLPAESE